MAAGRPIVGTGQNLPPIVDQTYNMGPTAAPQIEAYYTGSAIDKDRRGVAKAAQRWINRWIGANCEGTSRKALRQCRAMVVFDIDETLLNAFSYYVTQTPAFTYDPKTWADYQTSCGYSAIQPTIDLYQALRKRGVRLALVSAGSEAQRAVMTKCLQSKGVSGWSAYRLRGPDAAKISIGDWKASQRKELERAGNRIIASIGDQVSDMSHGHLMRGFLLPNTMYQLS